MKCQLPSRLLEQQFFSLATRRAPLSESIRLGAQLMLQKAVELEVTEFLGREHYRRSGDEPLLGYRDGYEDKKVQTAEGRTGTCPTRRSSTSSVTAFTCGCGPKTPRPWQFCVLTGSRPTGARCCSTWP